LSATSSEKPQAAVAARHLLLAAALYAQYIEGAEKDTALKLKAIKEVLLCRKANPELLPGSREFSPRFIEFFKSAK
jgi:hypothetical protein